MAPESTSTKLQAPRPAQPSGQTVIIPKPGAGEEVSVPSSPSGVLEFAFDPQQSTYSREDFNLVFETDDGGRVVVQDFFIVGDESLPDLKLPADADNPEGTTIASADFFTESGLDMSTAAGVPSAPPSGGSDASGDPLSMTTGIDALGTQGSWQYSQGTGAGADSQTFNTTVIDISTTLEGDGLLTLTLDDAAHRAPGASDRAIGTFTLTAGTDSIVSVSFADLASSMPQLKGVDGSVTWRQVGDTLIGSQDGTDLIKLSIIFSPIAAGPKATPL